MRFQKFKSNSCCVYGRHQFAAISIEKDTTKVSHNLAIGNTNQCNRKKSMIVSDNTVQSESLVKFLKIRTNKLC